jgi:hypothetical protein
MKSPPSLDDELSGPATKEIARRVASLGLAGFPNLAAHAVIVHSSVEGGYHILGVTFFLSADDIDDQRFRYSCVGVGQTKEDARNSVYEQWVVAFVPAFVHAVAQSDDRIDFNGLRIYFSTLMVRGRDGVDLEFDCAPKELALRLVTPYVQVVKSTVLRGATLLVDAQTISLSLHVSVDAGTEGEWLFNGTAMPAILADARSCGLPGQPVDYMLKQFYIFRGCPI